MDWITLLVTQSVEEDLSANEMIFDFPSTLSHNTCTSIHSRITFYKNNLYPNLSIPSLAQEKDMVLREYYS